MIAARSMLLACAMIAACLVAVSADCQGMPWTAPGNEVYDVNSLQSDKT